LNGKYNLLKRFSQPLIVPLKFVYALFYLLQAFFAALKVALCFGHLFFRSLLV